jgi:N4-gp56 family major capsid protein
MAKGITTSTQIDPGVDAYFTRMYLKIGWENNVTQQFADTYTIPMNNTTTIRMRKFDKLPRLSLLAEGVTPAATQMSKTDITANIYQYGQVVTVTDVMEYTNLDKSLRTGKELQAKTSMNTVEYLNFNILKESTTLYGASTGATSGVLSSYVGTTIASVTGTMNLTIANFIGKELRANYGDYFTPMVKASTGIGTSSLPDAYVMIVPTSMFMTFRNLTDFTPVENYSNGSRAFVGEIGYLGIFRVIMSDILDEFSEGKGANSKDVYPIICLAKSAWGTINLGGMGLQTYTRPFGYGEDHLDQRTSIGVKMWHGAKITDNDFMAVVHVEES